MITQPLIDDHAVTAGCVSILCVSILCGGEQANLTTARPPAREMSETISLRNITATPTEERPPLSAFEPDAQTSAPSVERLAGPSVAFEHPPSPVSAPLGLFLELAEPEAENSRSGDLAIPDLDVRPMEHFDSADFGGDGGVRLSYVPRIAMRVVFM